MHTVRDVENRSLAHLSCNQQQLSQPLLGPDGVGQQGLGDRGGGVVLQPVLHGGPLICVPVCSYHRLHHHCLSLTVPAAAGSGASLFTLPFNASTLRCTGAN